MDKNGLTYKIFQIAIPSIIGFVGLTLFEVVDIYWLGKLNSKAVAAAGACAFIEWILYAMMRLFNTGCDTLVAQAIGAKKENEKFDIIREAAFLSLVFSFIVFILFYPIKGYLFLLMGLDQETQIYAVAYFSILLTGVPVIFLLDLLGRIFNAHGDTKTSTLILLFVLFINLVLDPFLIFGWGGFPVLGIRGAAIASVFSMSIGIILRVYILRRKKYIPPLLSFSRISFKYLTRFLKIGIPSCVTNMIWSAVYPMLAVIVTKFGMAPLAALNICHRIEGIPYFFALGFSISMSTLVGQHYGAGNYKEVGRIVKRGGFLIVGLLVPVSLLYILIPEQLIMLLNKDEEIIKHGADYLRIIGYCEIFLGLEVAMEGAFNGLGYTRPYLLIRGPLTLLRIPMAWYLAIYLGMGTVGIWWSISLTTGLKGILMVISFFKRYGLTFRDAFSRQCIMEVPKRDQDLLTYHSFLSSFQR
ncbi:MAG: hypothetical protein A2381_18315 [Bdellovibrionales bacterium RIFOXYB1_FULL_37_110]|nr:MAG: hypothetical protein A2417_01455 [Bdellovibrionales bacterium RIFOXYC1_FULL_37_79]OFZ58988.1 MAG: hypothetical protein A2381_18315 [Bdellovibrionales bacterium RIFOXYB1_FULL_37_110]OFZ64718.1 MAG: hypothetical protein A2577_06600 [Bdellovibrionales bacterium RIFOXYD1_FULL_36_51]